MEGLLPIWKQRLTYAAYAITLVWALSLYKSHGSGSPLAMAQQHWQVLSVANPDLMTDQYSDQAVVKHFTGVSQLDGVHRGQSIYSAWQKFFSAYQIQYVQVVEAQQGDRAVEAQIEITARSTQGATVKLSMYYQVHFDQSGKIVKEVWQTNRRFNA